MKPILFSLILCLTGCASVYRGEGVTVPASEALVGEWDDTYYLQSLSEFNRFNIWYRNRTSAVQSTPYWDCDKWARDYVNSMCKKYASYPFVGQSPAVQMRREGRHMIAVVETSDRIVRRVEPKTAREIK